MGPRIVSLAASLTVLSALPVLVGCANQKEVIPLLHVEPNAGPRMLYFERRAREMLAAQSESPEEDDFVLEDAQACAPPPQVLETWGVSSRAADAGSEGTSCDPEESD